MSGTLVIDILYEESMGQVMYPLSQKAYKLKFEKYVHVFFKGTTQKQRINP